MKIDLHVHTEHSFDCESSIDEVIRHASDIGLDAIAITDHDNLSAYGIAKKTTKDIIIIPAMEITAAGGTHIIGLFLEDEIFSRDIFDIIEEVHNQNGLVMIPHPFRPGTGLIYNKEKRNHFNGEEIRKILSEVDLIEAVNFRCRQQDMLNTDKFLAICPDIARTAGSDAHFVDEVGKAYVELEKVKSNSLKDIKKALINSPRQIRYEAFSVEGKRELIAVQGGARKRSIISKTRKIIPSTIRRSIRAIYKKSAGKMWDT